MSRGDDRADRHAEYIAQVMGRHGGQLASRTGYLASRRRDDLVDALVLGGIEIARLVDGTVDVSQVDHDVLEAFRRQYPDQDLGELLRGAAGSETELQGLVSGIKGKLFESEYVDWLNGGHLPEGYSAELAASATQPGWDIRIVDAGGVVQDELQAKASEHAAYVTEALHRYPGIDVVATHEAFEKLAESDLTEHVRDSTISDHALEAHVSHELSEAIDGGFHVPWLAFTVIAVQTARRWSRDPAAAGVILRDAAQRGLKGMIASLASQGIVLATGEPVVGPAVVFSTRLMLARWVAHQSLVAGLDASTKMMRGLEDRLTETMEASASRA